MTTQQQSNSDSESSNISREIIALLPMKSPQQSNSESEKSPQQSNSDSEGVNMPNEIIERIFGSLPPKIICRAKAVCEGWNALLSSTEFWVRHASINPHHTWLMFCIDHPTLENILYSLSTNTWKTVPMTFMPRYKTGVKYYGSYRGIVLVGVGAYPQTLFLCNPLLRQFRQLPPTLSIELNSFSPKGIAFGKDNVYCKVVAIGLDHSKGKNVVEIYNSYNSSWKTAGKIPRHYTLRKEIEFCKSSLYCLLSHPKNLMVYCSIKEDVCNEMKYVRLPVPNPHRNKTIHYNLVALGASILLTTVIRDIGSQLSDMRIWEFQMIDGNAEDSSAYINSPWKEIARMPEPMCEELGRDGWWYECVAEGDYAFFRNGESEKVVIYNLREGSWKWVPPSPCRWVSKVHTITGIALRPDFKL